MDVQLDDERTNVIIGGASAPFADTEEDDNGLPLIQSIRTGGGWDVTLTLPDGRRTTFAFTPRVSPSESKAYAEWTPSPDVVGVTLKSLDPNPDISFIPGLPPHWDQADENSTFDNHDISG